jgi:hypothetical protein
VEKKKKKKEKKKHSCRRELTSKGKGEIHPRTGHEGPEGEQRNSFTISLTSALDGRGDITLHALQKRELHGVLRRPVLYGKNA